MNNRKAICGIFAVAAVLAAACTPVTAIADGRLSVEFEENTFASMFDVYTETAGDTPVFTSDGYMISTGRAENKVLLKNPDALSSFTVEADFYPIDGDLCQFSSGFYIYASKAGGALDGITAYNVAVERDYAAPTAALRVHRFDQGYKGVVAETSVKLERFPVNMKVTADNGRVKVYVYDDPVAVIDTVLPSYSAGKVGFRTFRGNAGKIGNVRLTADSIKPDVSELQALTERAEAVDIEDYTDQTASALSDALEGAKAALGSTVQSVVDGAAKRLSDALAGLTEKYTYDDLTALISNAEPLCAQTGVYTSNSIRSLESVLSRAKAIDAADADGISELAKALDQAINALAKYDFMV